MLDQLINN